MTTKMWDRNLGSTRVDPKKKFRAGIKEQKKNKTVAHAL
jgi:hypothetical protein